MSKVVSIHEARTHLSALLAEVSVKHRRGKLSLPAQPLEWFEAVVDHHGLQVLSVGLPTCIRSTELPARARRSSGSHYRSDSRASVPSRRNG